MLYPTFSVPFWIYCLRHLKSFKNGLGGHRKIFLIASPACIIFSADFPMRRCGKKIREKQFDLLTYSFYFNRSGGHRKYIYFCSRHHPSPIYKRDLKKRRNFPDFWKTIFPAENAGDMPEKPFFWHFLKISSLVFLDILQKDAY